MSPVTAHSSRTDHAHVDSSGSAPSGLPQPSAEEVAARLARVVGRIGRRTRPTHGGLSVGHYSTLSTIDRLGPQRLGDLARVERVSAPTMTRLVTTLERRGFAERTANPDDARSVTVDVTDAGRAVILEARAERAATVASLVDVLDEDQLARLADALDALEVLAVEAMKV